MAVTASQGGFITLLKNKNFLRLWLAQLISLTILFASNYGLLVLIEEVTGSTTLVGLAIISFSLPALLLGGPAGVYVDRLNKRRVLWGSNCLRAIATFAFVVALLLNRHELIPIYLLTFLVSCIGQFFTPAEGSSIPLLVGEDEMMPALSLFNITLMLAQALGFLLFAPLTLSLLPTFKIFSLAIDPIESLYLIVAVLYVVCAILIAMIPPEPFSQRAGQAKKPVSTQDLEIVSSMWGEMLQGWSFVRRNKQLFLAVIQLSFAGVLLLVIGELASPIVTQLLHLPAKEMAFVFAPAGIGLVTGSILMPRIVPRLGKPRAVFIGSLTLASTALLVPLVTLLAQTLQPNGWNTNPLLLLVVGLLMFLAGFGLDFINIPAMTAMQELTPDWIKGRVLALQLMLYNACSIPIILFVGASADLFGIDRVIYLISACELAFGLWGIYYGYKHPQVIPDIDQKQEEKTVETANLPGKP